MSGVKTRTVSLCLALIVPVSSVTVAQADSVSKRASVEALSELVTTGPAPTQEQIDEIHEYLGPQAVEELNRALLEVNDGDRALPVIAGVAISAVAWCASGALSSVPDSVLTDIVNRGAGGGDYIQNAVIGCVTGATGKIAWKVIPPSVKQKILNAAVKFYLDHIRKK
ncbi:hypothetical protein F7230_09285 [Corynebacterium sp. 320]|uniref:hypothetical protein n=1 Tax=Corynebacterium TaxID=1716 RepID=UPI00125CBF29|nr:MULTISPECIES: hypothetical protein [Corynebacterium]KAB1501408.1 hypothetical protein F7230_09285 [Corynebacterium sp. 320]KAB3525766.1 hypothetical protein F8354_09285 [Corynebacterium sp. 250]QNP92653.1 hypothetical protein IAU67_02270 [Corynebacterium zhongnanshanii]